MELTDIKCPKCSDCLYRDEIKSDVKFLTKEQYKLKCNCCGFEKIVLQT